ncbi:membrane transport protein-domain-containing protein [Aspergillus bertholletiae]|uniref:Membrane transport protein-domain-containing protein n=1 Tax=Aspergillus bertholletiae TaxID=1226010 RepID=A0A5N7BDB9_9EURO|nr:membrane transport protein-domain-containing protein [Aspergillus bertholletiae]
MIDGGIVVPLVGALQACVSVLLTMSYGVAAQRLRLVQESSINDMVGLGVKLFLPALIIIHLGEDLQLENALNYIPVIIWSILYTCSSIGLAYFVSKGLKLPAWVTPACAFNNTTSLPLLLLQSLESVGSLNPIIQNGDTESKAISRAQSYFLLCAVISKTIGYIVGPKLLQDGESIDTENQRAGDADPETQNGTAEHGHANEETPLLSQQARKARGKISTSIRRGAHLISSILPKRIRQRLMAPFESPFADVAITCTVIGAVLGLVPQLHKAFFNKYEDGGIFNAWLTSSVKNIGKLFTTFQIFVVGCKLGVSFERMKASGDSGQIPLKAIVTIFLVRLVIWPVVSISVVYGLAKRTNLVLTDPILWFSLMLMPVGPPALVISGLAELARVSEPEKMAIAKSLTVMYALSPFFCFSITGALKASQAALEQRNAT